MRKALVLGVLGLAGTLASPAFAEDNFTGWRLGMTAGQEAFQSDVNWRGYTQDTDENRLGYGFFGGWALNRYFAVEVGYKTGGAFNAQILSNGAFPTREIELDTEMRGFEGSVTGAWWITKQFSLYGRAGMYAWKGEYKFKEDLNIDNPSNPIGTEHFEDDGAEPFFGAGVQTVLDNALVRLEYQMFETSDFVVPGILTMRNNKDESLNLSVVWTLR
jgi:OOP family OmpA-OmpF porin/outer membrane immunogenic protein